MAVHSNVSISSVNTSWIKKSTTGLLTKNEKLVYANITTADITLSFPAVTSLSDGEEHTIQNKSTSTKNVIMTPTGVGVTAGGASSVTLIPGDHITFIYEHSTTDWFKKE